METYCVCEWAKAEEKFLELSSYEMDWMVERRKRDASAYDIIKLIRRLDREYKPAFWPFGLTGKDSSHNLSSQGGGWRLVASRSGLAGLTLLGQVAG